MKLSFISMQSTVCRSNHRRWSIFVRSMLPKRWRRDVNWTDISCAYSIRLWSSRVSTDRMYFSIWKDICDVIRREVCVFESTWFIHADISSIINGKIAIFRHLDASFDYNVLSLSAGVIWWIPWAINNENWTLHRAGCRLWAVRSQLWAIILKIS